MRPYTINLWQERIWKIQCNKLNADVPQNTNNNGLTSWQPNRSAHFLLKTNATGPWSLPVPLKENTCTSRADWSPQRTPQVAQQAGYFIVQFIIKIYTATKIYSNL